MLRKCSLLFNLLSNDAIHSLSALAVKHTQQITYKEEQNMITKMYSALSGTP